jgi:ornithine cyclodeaminase
LRAQILQADWIEPGMMINAIGGDAPGKTELDPQILADAKVVVDFLDQAQHEGEIQNYQPGKIYAELWELAAARKKGRVEDKEIFVFDSVGMALEDYTTLKLIYSLAEDFHVGHMLDVLPEIKNPKNLFAELL